LSLATTLSTQPKLPTHPDILKENQSAARAFDGKMQFSVRAVAPDVGHPKPRPSVLRGWWAVIPIVIGMTLVAACVLVPAAGELDQLRHDLALLDREVEHARKQVEVNRDFVASVQSDPGLRKRLQAMQDLSVPGNATDSPTRDETGSTLEPVRLQKPVTSVSALSLPTIEPDATPITTVSGVPMILRPLTHSTARVIVLGVGLMLVAWGLLFGGKRLTSEKH